jgi:zinc protease
MSRKSVLVRAATAVAATLLIAACTPSTPKFAIKYAEKRGTITKNGLRFVIVPDATTQMVEVDIRYDVGSREDPVGKAGIAHLVEHLMFQQRPDGPATPPLMHFLDQLTVFFNAFTNWDTTHYMTSSRADMTDALLKIEAMRMYFGCKTITEEEFAREREVVRNEIRWRGGDARGEMERMVLDAVYPKGHAYSREIGGNDAQLATITLQDACDFMEKYYTPERATIVVAGGVKVDEVTAMIQKWFGNMDKRVSGARVAVEPVTIDPTRVTFDVDIERPMVHVAWALPPGNTAEGEAVRFGLNRFFFGAASKAQEYGFATQVLPQLLGGRLAPVFVISIELKNKDKLNEALEFVWKAANQAHRGFDMASWKQMEEFKAVAKADFISSIEPLMNRTLQIGESVQFDTEIEFASSEEYIIHELKKIDDFDGGRVRDAVKKALDESKAKVIVINNTKTGTKGDKRSSLAFATKSDEMREVSEVDPKEASRPLKVAATLKTLDAAQRFELKNGMQVVLLPIDSMPLVAAQLQFTVGTAVDAAVADAAAGFLNGPIDAEATQAAGISVRCGATPDTTICSTRGVNIYLDVMIKALERQISAGDYNQKQIEEYAKSYKDDLKRQDSQTEFEFQRQIYGALYGPEHPYTLAAAVPPDAISKLGHDKLVSFKGKHYKAANATLIVAGNFDPAKAESLIRGSFGGWSSGKKQEPVPPDQFPRTGPQYIGVIGKDQPQTTLRILFPSAAGVDGQEAARRVLAQMLNSRMEDLRFKLGSTYGTYARHLSAVGPTAYAMGGDVDTARTGESLKAMREGVAMYQRVAAGTGTQADLDQFQIDFVRARRKLVQVLLGESTVSAELATRLGFIARYGLEKEFFNNLLQRTAAVSTAQVKALIAAELKSDTEVVVTRGTREQITKTFADAGINDVKIVEPEYE